MTERYRRCSAGHQAQLGSSAGISSARSAYHATNMKQQQELQLLTWTGPLRRSHFSKSQVRDAPDESRIEICVVHPPGGVMSADACLPTTAWAGFASPLSTTVELTGSRLQYLLARLVVLVSGQRAIALKVRALCMMLYSAASSKRQLVIVARQRAVEGRFILIYILTSSD